MQSINAVIDSSIHLNTYNLPSNIVESITARLTVPNPARKVAEREMLRDAKKIPATLSLYKRQAPDRLLLPRGFVFELEQFLKGENIEVKWQNNMPKFPWVHHSDKVIDLRQYQREAVGNLWAYGSGVYKAPTGSGKTRVMLELIRMLKFKTIIIVEKADIAVQWQQFADKLGFKSVGLIGQGVWNDECALTIATRQSVWSRIDSLVRNDWFNMFGMVVVDECHHVASETMFEIVGRFSAPCRYGCSATPDSDLEIFPIARAVIGPVVHESSLEEIGEHLVIPSVRVIPTEFTYPYRPTERVQLENKRWKVIRNNYSDMMFALQDDKRRNRQIIELVAKEAADGHCCLVLSKRKLHLYCMYEQMNIFHAELQTISRELTGDNSDEYGEIAKQIENAEKGFVLFSTLAEEGTDIPRLDRLFLTYPGRKLRGFEQAIGRIMRPHQKKKDAIVYDFRDMNVPLLNSQFRDRAHCVYNKKGYNVQTGQVEA